MTEKPARRWWSFSLWQLLAIMTVVAIYCGYEINSVRSRNSLLQKLRKQYYLSVIEAKDYSGHEARAAVPVVRGWFGDQPIQSISYYRHQLSEADVNRIRWTFPEAKIIVNEQPLEPCHPGCFPHGTLVDTPFGPQKIDAIAVGDEVWTISPQGKRISLPVVSIFRTTNRLWNVETSRGTLRTTETQPLCTQLDQTVEAGKLRAGDVILGWSPNEGDDGQLHEVRVISVTQTDEIVPVVNLVLGNREPFIAGGYLARSKPPRDEVPVDQLISSKESKHLHEHQP